MSSSVFRFFNPDGPKEDPVQKRRGQLRRAQRTYRDRKERYTKLLETELGQTRANEAKLMRECEQLRANLQNALELLAQSNAAGNLSQTTDVSPISSSDLLQSLPDFDTQLLSPASFNAAYVSPDNYISPENYVTSGSHVSPQSYATSQSHGTPNAQDDSVPSDGRRHTLWPTDTRKSSRVSEMDEVTVAMEFVLKIEEPCLGHIHGDPNKPDEPNGHALTATSQLLCISSNETAAQTEWRPSPPKAAPLYQNAPSAILQRLLALAPDLSSEGEMTPIQAWHNIRSRPQFGGLDQSRLLRLGESLRKAVKCHGFGAVVQRSVFETLLFENITLGQSF
jgi:hypothetical protein